MTGAARSSRQRQDAGRVGDRVEEAQEIHHGERRCRSVAERVHVDDRMGRQPLVEHERDRAGRVVEERERRHRTRGDAERLRQPFRRPE